jgi:hypothetical protein
MEQKTICKRNAHRYPEAMFYYDKEKAIAATDASGTGAFFKKYPAELKDLKEIKFFVNGKTYYANYPVFKEQKERNGWVLTYASFIKNDKISIENPIKEQFEGIIKKYEDKIEEYEKLIQEQKENREKSIYRIKASLKTNYEYMLKSIKEGPISFPLNKTRLGLLSLCSLLCFITIILPVSRILFAGINPGLYHIIPSAVLILFGGWLGYQVIKLIVNKRTGQEGYINDNILPFTVNNETESINKITMETNTQETSKSNEPMPLPEDSSEKNITERNDFVKINARVLPRENAPAIAMLGTFSFVLIALPLLMLAFGTITTTEVSSEEEVLFGVIIGAGLISVIVLSIIMFKMQINLDEYVRNDTRIAYVNYLNQVLLALSMPDYSADTLKKAIEEIRKAGDQFINCTYK